MSALSTRRPKTDVAAPALPQVNLLPGSIRAKRALARTKRFLASALVAVVALVTVAALGAQQVNSRAQARLSTAQDKTIALMKEKGEYTEAPRVLGQVQDLRGALEQGFATEVSWKPYVSALLAVLPEGTHLRTIELKSATPMLAAEAPTSPLQGASVATLTFTGDTTTVPDTGKWIDALDAIPGFSDAWVRTGELTADQERSDEPFYKIESSVQVNTAAFANRFVGLGDEK